MASAGALAYALWSRAKEHSKETVVVSNLTDASVTIQIKNGGELMSSAVEPRTIGMLMCTKGARAWVDARQLPAPLHSGFSYVLEDGKIYEQAMGDDGKVYEHHKTLVFVCQDEWMEVYRCAHVPRCLVCEADNEKPEADNEKPDADNEKPEADNVKPEDGEMQRSTGELATSFRVGAVGAGAVVGGLASLPFVAVTVPVGAALGVGGAFLGVGLVGARYGASLLRREAEEPTAAWMWADAGNSTGDGLFGHALAVKNPMRWSGHRSLTNTIADIEQHEMEKRPITVKVDGEEGVKDYSTTQKAVAGLKEIQRQFGQKLTAKCSCGNVFMTDSLLCQRCGEKRKVNAEVAEKAASTEETEVGQAATAQAKQQADETAAKPTYWADAAFQIGGQDGQAFYDQVMKVTLSQREAEFHRLCSTYWADKAFHIGGQAFYDQVMLVILSQREAEFHRLSSTSSAKFD